MGAPYFARSDGGGTGVDVPPTTLLAIADAVIE
jgi:hypothetical protein